MEENQSKDWTIPELYKKSWQTVKNNKILWLFGMAVASMASGGISRFNFNPKDLNFWQKLFNNPSAYPASGRLSQVLGAATLSQFNMVFSQIAAAIPPYVYILLVLEIILAIISWVIFGVISNSWSSASLISGIQKALHGGKPTIRNSSEKAFGHIKPLVWLRIVPGLLLASVSTVIFIVLGFALTLGPTSLRVTAGILMIICFGALVYFFIFLILAQIWALRLVVLDGKSGRSALFSGYRISRKKFWPTVLLGLINTIFSILVMAVPAILAAGLLIGGVSSFSRNQVAGWGLGFGGILAVGFILGLTLLSGIITAFKATIWTIAYIKIQGEDDENN